MVMLLCCVMLEGVGANPFDENLNAVLLLWSFLCVDKNWRAVGMELARLKNADRKSKSIHE